VDRDQRLVGAMTLRELLLAPGETPLASLMVSEPYRIRATDDRARVLSHPGWREVHSLPVVDDEGGYLGAIRYRTLREIEEELRSPDARDDSASSAFGELIAAGAGGLLDALVTSGRHPQRDTERRERSQGMGNQGTPSRGTKERGGRDAG
jgi:hypothetical protein